MMEGLRATCYPRVDSAIISAIRARARARTSTGNRRLPAC
jgi:hypothetical protein